MKKVIKVIFTGGTIGSRAVDGTVDLDGGANRKLLDMYSALCGDGISFVCDEPVSMLSENVHEEQLAAIYAAVKATSPHDVDGIIITHGTDSMCINAHYFSLTLCDMGLPIVLVSSLYPLDDDRQNGLKNFAAAVDFIEKGGAKGVFVSFANGNGPAEIHLAGRLMFCDQMTGWYRSVLGQSLAKVVGGEVIYNPSPVLPGRELLATGGQKSVAPEICRDVMLITARSLLNFSLYDFDRRAPRAVILEPYHSDTVCTSGRNLNFKQFASYCKERGVEVVIASVDSRSNVYASAVGLPESVICAYDECTESALTKVMCALGANLSAGAYLKDNIFFEKIRRY